MVMAQNYKAAANVLV